MPHLGGRLGSVPRDRVRIVAADDDEAIKTCRAVSIRPEPTYFELRTSDLTSRILYTSPVRARDA